MSRSSGLLYWQAFLRCIRWALQGSCTSCCQSWDGLGLSSLPSAPGVGPGRRSRLPEMDGLLGLRRLYFNFVPTHINANWGVYFNNQQNPQYMWYRVQISAIMWRCRDWAVHSREKKVVIDTLISSNWSAEVYAVAIHVSNADIWEEISHICMHTATCQHRGVHSMQIRFDPSGMNPSPGPDSPFMKWSSATTSCIPIIIASLSQISFLGNKKLFLAHVSNVWSSTSAVPSFEWDEIYSRKTVQTTTHHAR
jgi:hypothetical protein